MKTRIPVDGSFERRRKAASPIVAVNTATSEPKLILPWINWVTTIIAPPQPGSAPRIVAIGTWNVFVLFKKFSTLNFVNESIPMNMNNVKPTKTETCK